MNKVFMTGRLVKDPEMRDVKVGNDTIKNCRFRIAVPRRNAENETDFFNVVVWRKLAETCNKYLKKGSQVGLVGRIENTSFKGKDGKDVQSVEIVADDIEFLSRVASDEQSEITSQNTTNSNKTETRNISNADLEPIDDSDMPF